MIERIQLTKRSYLQRESERPGAELKRTLTNDAITFEGQKRERKDEQAAQEETAEQTTEQSLLKDEGDAASKEVALPLGNAVSHVDIRV